MSEVGYNQIKEQGICLVGAIEEDKEETWESQNQ